MSSRWSLFFVICALLAWCDGQLIFENAQEMLNALPVSRHAPPNLAEKNLDKRLRICVDSITNRMVIPRYPQATLRFITVLPNLKLGIVYTINQQPDHDNVVIYETSRTDLSPPFGLPVHFQEFTQTNDIAYEDPDWWPPFGRDMPHKIDLVQAEDILRQHTAARWTRLSIVQYSPRQNLAVKDQPYYIFTVEAGKKVIPGRKPYPAPLSEHPPGLVWIGLNGDVATSWTSLNQRTNFPFRYGPDDLHQK